jgi:hypothetical protein
MTAKRLTQKGAANGESRAFGRLYHVQKEPPERVPSGSGTHD